MRNIVFGNPRLQDIINPSRTKFLIKNGNHPERNPHYFEENLRMEM